MSSIKSSLLILISVNLIQMNNGAVMTKTTAPTAPVTLPVTTSSGGPASGGPVFTKTTKGAVMTKTTGASNIKTTVPLSGSCKTGYGNNCRFPFIYAGKTYTTCTNVDYGNTFWCATSIRSNGQARTFDVCTPSCPHESVVRDPNCATVLGKACIFPFTAFGTTYNSCTKVQNNDIPWCATSVDSNHRFVEYETCNSACSIA
uniref:Matrix metallopeptidase 9 (Gelatinase B, 92kDa gelatinase, 92kDa type IV collagenase) [Nomascus leucogenys] n=1 Tax=Lepeophtheirus salmonis TaxID=72036 RepID=A0A0K2U7B0_LEPSM